MPHKPIENSETSVPKILFLLFKYCSSAIWYGLATCGLKVQTKKKKSRLLVKRKIWCSTHLVTITRTYSVPPDHLFLDRSPNIGPLISRSKLDKFKNCWNKSFRTSKILTLLYELFSNLLIFQRDMSGRRLGALANNIGDRGVVRNKMK